VDISVLKGVGGDVELAESAAPEVAAMDGSKKASERIRDQLDDRLAGTGTILELQPQGALHVDPTIQTLPASIEQFNGPVRV